MKAHNKKYGKGGHYVPPKKDRCPMTDVEFDNWIDQITREAVARTPDEAMRHLIEMRAKNRHK